ncbi:hypothetical protein E5288_WYG003983 [Bos mutus]|uniref:Mut7-C RNAse domain-containing protein n=1 Tax=Bos mutus TaxID=72004 RepID=A0A6B0SB19_9CETA|nr:hypothetical protein [Bos mutus]
MDPGDPEEKPAAGDPAGGQDPRLFLQTLQTLWSTRELRQLREEAWKWFAALDNPLTTLLDMLDASRGCGGRDPSLEAWVARELERWLQAQPHPGPAQGGRALKPLQARAVRLLTEGPPSLVEPLVSIFQLQDADRSPVLAHIHRLHQEGKFKEAIVLGTKLQLQADLDAEKMCVPLLLQDKVGLAERYVDSLPHLQQRLLALMDSWCQPGFDIRVVARQYPQATLRLERLSPRALGRHVLRLLEQYSLDPALCPNAVTQQRLAALRYLCYKRLVERSMSQESWAELVQVSSEVLAHDDPLWGRVGHSWNGQESRILLPPPPVDRAPSLRLPSPQDTGLQPVSPVLSWRRGLSWCRTVPSSGRSGLGGRWALGGCWGAMCGAVCSGQEPGLSLLSALRGLPVGGGAEPPLPCPPPNPSDRPGLVSHHRGTRTPGQGPEGRSPLGAKAEPAGRAADILKNVEGFPHIVVHVGTHSLREAATEAAGDRAVWGRDLPHPVDVFSSVALSQPCGPCADSRGGDLAVLFSRVTLWVLFAMMSSVNTYQHAFKEGQQRWRGKGGGSRPRSRSSGAMSALAGSRPFKDEPGYQPRIGQAALRCLPVVLLLGVKCEWGGRRGLALGVGLQPHLPTFPPAQVARQEGRVILTSGLPYHKLRAQVGAGRCLAVDCSLKAQQQAKAILRHFNVRVTPADIFSRCQACNCDQYLKVSKDVMKQLVRLSVHLGGPGGASSESSHSDGEQETDSAPEEAPGHCSYDPPCRWLEDADLQTHVPATLANGTRLQLAGVPAGVLRRPGLRHFYCCPGCGKVFWEGTHLARVTSNFQEILEGAPRPASGPS